MSVHYVNLCMLKYPLEFIWIYDTCNNHLVIENNFTKYLKESCWWCSDYLFKLLLAAVSINGLIC